MAHISFLLAFLSHTELFLLYLFVTKLLVSENLFLLLLIKSPQAGCLYLRDSKIESVLNITPNMTSAKETNNFRYNINS